MNRQHLWRSAFANVHFFLKGKEGAVVTTAHKNLVAFA